MVRRRSRASLFRDLSWADVQEWAGEQVADLGRSVQHGGAVQEMGRAPDGSVLGWVADGDRYAAWVDVDSEQIRTVCSCRPQGVCRHAVALALEYRALLRRQQAIPQIGREDPRLSLLERLTGRELVTRGVAPAPRPVAPPAPPVLHAVWGTDARLHLWAEDPARLSAATMPVNDNRARPHPFACRAERLREALGGLAGADGELPLLLPSGPIRPQGSPEVPGGGGRAGRLATWTVPVLSLPAAEATAFLLGSPLPAGLAGGESIRFWAAAARLGLAVLAGGRILPALVPRSPGYQARWRLVSDTKTRRRLQTLESSMPPSCRAGAPEVPPAALLEDMVESVIDGCARQVLSQRQLDPSRGGGTASDAWLSALASPQETVEAPPGELTKLEEALERWGGVAGSGALRTCFRLVPPDADEDDEEDAAPAESDGPWSLEFLVQAADNPELVAPASEAWEARGAAAFILGRAMARPQERILADLAQAARLYPPLMAALQAARLTALEMDLDGAYDFLRRGVPALEEAGFGVIVPAWWGRPEGRLGARLQLDAPAKPGGKGPAPAGAGGICAYRWEVALGDETITWEEFRELAALQTPLVKLGDRWVEIRPEDVNAALHALEKGEPEGQMTVFEALRVSAGMDPSPVGLPVAQMQAPGWLGELLAGDPERRMAEIKTPKNFRGELRPYQERGLAWLSFMSELAMGACLADDMGLGKTIQMLAQLVAERQKASPGPTLLVCPMSVVGNWQREAAKFAPKLKVHVHHGGDRLSGEAFTSVAGAKDLVITTYGLTTREKEQLAEVPWHRIVLDEAQNIKNPAAAQTRAVRALKAGLRVAMTGTPVENRLTELWSIMDFLNPGLLGTATDFRERFANPIEKNRDATKSDVLRRLTGPFILRRLKTDRTIIQDLPEKLEMKVYCNLTREQAALYKAHVDEMMQKIEDSKGIERKGHVLATMLRLKQICNHPAHLLQDRSKLQGRSGKLARLEEVLEEALAEGDKALIFTQFAEWGKLLQPYLHKRLEKEVLYLHGGTTRTAREDMVARFQEPGGPPILLLSLKAGGTGLNLTAANQVIHFDRWWNPAVEDQATDRAFRIGQRRDVQVRKLICVGTLEERIDQMIEQKKDLADRIIGSGEAWLTELSTAQIREIVALSADAVGEE